MNQQREIIYGQRRKVLDGEDISAEMHNMLRALLQVGIFPEEDTGTYALGFPDKSAYRSQTSSFRTPSV